VIARWILTGLGFLATAVAVVYLQHCVHIRYLTSPRIISGYVIADVVFNVDAVTMRIFMVFTLSLLLSTGT